MTGALAGVNARLEGVDRPGITHGRSSRSGAVEDGGRGTQAVGVADGIAAFRVDPGGPEAGLAVVAPGMSSAVLRGDVRRLDGAPTFATHAHLPADISQHWARTSSPSSNSFAQGPWLPPPSPPSAGPGRSPPTNDRQRRLSTCTADLRVSAPEAQAIERARDRIRIIVSACDATMDAHSPSLEIRSRRQLPCMGEDELAGLDPKQAAPLSAIESRDLADARDVARDVASVADARSGSTCHPLVAGGVGAGCGGGLPISSMRPSATSSKTAITMLTTAVGRPQKTKISAASATAPIRSACRCA